MKIMFKFILFMVLFNVAAVMIATTGFFGENVLYGDIVSDDPDNLAAPETVIENLWRKPIDNSLPSFTIKILGKETDIVVFNWVTLTIGIFVLCLLIGRIMHATPSIVAAGVVGSVFLLMYVNSKKLFDSITASMDSSVNYIVLMIGIGFMFLVIITIMDYISGQRSGGD